MNAQGLTVGSLFSGIGGLDLGLESCGMNTVWQCEADKNASKVLARRWGVPNLGDITQVDWSAVIPVDVLAGGFPCQDISIAGKGAGLAGSRSGLWRHYAQGIEELQPTYVFIENVSALIARGLETVVEDLARLRYVGQWGCVRASDISAPHRRERVFVFARRLDADAPARQGRSAIRRQRGTKIEGDPSEATVHHIPVRWATRAAQLTLGGDFETQRVAEVVAGINSWGEYAEAVTAWEAVVGPAPRPTGKDDRLDPGFVEWMMGLPQGWTTGISRQQRLRCLGNAVVPQQAAFAWKSLAKPVPRQSKHAAA